MSQALAGPDWAKNGRCRSRYIWHTDNNQLQMGKFNQAARITLARRQTRSKHSKIEPELYVCKWYATAGLGGIDSGGSSISGLKYIQREAAAFASINHSNIVRFQDFSYELGKAQLARLYMEYCPRGDLSQFVRHSNGTSDSMLSYNEGGQVLNQLARALLYLHHGVFKTDEDLKLAKLDFGVFKFEEQLHLTSDTFQHFESVQNRSRWRVILHRDVKPANVFVAERDHGRIKVKLGDFGLVKFEAEGTDTYVGSRDYFAPEQRSACENQRTTFKSDVYALGVTIREVIRPDESNDISITTPIQFCVERLISGCLELDDSIRLSSANIVDEIRTYLVDCNSGATMLAEAVNNILEFDTKGGTSKRKKLKAELADLGLLCRRLLEAGCDPNVCMANNMSILDSVIGFVNLQLELLGEAPQPAYPPWKASAIEELADVLRLNNAKGETQLYNTGSYRYESFSTETKMRRVEILLEVLLPKFAICAEDLKPKIVALLQRNAKFTDLLKFTVDEKAFALEVKKIEDNLGIRSALNQASTNGKSQREKAVSTEQTIPTNTFELKASKLPRQSTFTERKSPQILQVRPNKDRVPSYDMKQKAPYKAALRGPHFSGLRQEPEAAAGAGAGAAPLEKPSGRVIVYNPRVTPREDETPDNGSLIFAKIYSATYSNVPVYEYIVGVHHILRRRSDDWINATHILKAADYDKPARARTLEREVQKGVHEKVQGGYGKYQGTWIPLPDGKELATKHGVYDTLRPIFEYVPGDRSPSLAPNHATAADAALSTTGKEDGENTEQEETEEERMDRLIAWMEAAEREEEVRERAYQEKRRKEKEAAAPKKAEEQAKRDEELRRQEREAEAREEQNERERAAAEIDSEDSDREAKDIFAQLKKPTYGPRASAPSSGTETHASEEAKPSPIPPPAHPASRSLAHPTGFTAAPKSKPAHLKLETSKRIEITEATPGMQALESARFLPINKEARYPDGFKSPNPALNVTSARRGRAYDKDFLLQFQTVFREKPSVDWDQKIRATFDPGDESGS